MKHFIHCILLLLVIPEMVYGQLSVTNDMIEDLKKIPNEKVYVHANTSLLFSGEYLYYALYCVEESTSSLSPWSKIAYVELISEDNDQIFKHKINLNNGFGSSDFFIPVTIPSGSYKLIAYTQWMQNGTLHEFYKQNIHIINPYRANELKAIGHNKNIDSTVLNYVKPKQRISTSTSDTPFTIVLTKELFKKRSRVQMVIDSKAMDSISSGNYSISVRKKGIIPSPENSGITAYLDNSNATTTNFNASKFYLPELRGQLISGRVTGENNIRTDNLRVGISIPGEAYFFTIVKTNTEGRFFINLKDGYSNEEVFLQVIEENPSNLKIVLDSHESPNYKDLTFQSLEIDSIFQKEILERSIHNQIENAFYTFKPDSILAAPIDLFFDSKKELTYNLDDFTRFTSVKETVFEIIKDVFAKNISKDETAILVQGYNFHSSTGILPLLLVNGLIIQDHTILLNLDAKFFKSITVYRDQFIIGPSVYQGAILLKTKDGIPNRLQGDALYTSSLLKPQLQKNYYNQQHSIETRIPDDRTQLLWNPQVHFTKANNKIEFFTSDVTGTYEISIEGIYNNKEPFSIRKSFIVE